MSDAEALALFRDGIEICPACGAAITWNRSPDGSSVEILHPYDPKAGPPCAPFKAFCAQLEQRARDSQRVSSHVSSAALKKSAT